MIVSEIFSLVMNYSDATNGVSKMTKLVIPHLTRNLGGMAKRPAAFNYALNTGPLDSRLHGNDVGDYLTRC